MRHSCTFPKYAVAKKLTVLVTTACIAKGRRPLIRFVGKYNLFWLLFTVGKNIALFSLP